MSVKNFEFSEFCPSSLILPEMENVSYLKNCYRYSNFRQILDHVGTLDPEYNAYEIFYIPNSGSRIELSQKWYNVDHLEKLLKIEQLKANFEPCGYC